MNSHTDPFGDPRGDERSRRIKARRQAFVRKRRRVVSSVVVAALVGAAVVAGIMVWGGAPPADTRTVQETPNSEEDALARRNGATATPAPTPTGALATPEPADATVAAIDALPATTGYSTYDYDRDLFGQSWADVDRNGCDTRNDILRRDLTELVIKDNTDGCKVLGGVLDDWYTGESVQFVSGTDTSWLVQIDHIVPLAWAWRQGAEFWTDEQRELFANDPLNLIAVTGSVNQSKSDSGPAEWMPPDPTAACSYIDRYIEILTVWHLGIPDDDRSAARAVAMDCAG